jgi:hypothetical protein
MTAVGLDSEFSILPAKLIVIDDNLMKIVPAETVIGYE